MKVHDRRVGLPLLTLCVVVALTGATWPLNPLVTRNAQPTGAVPVECEQGLAPAPSPRVNLAEIPQREIVLTAATIPAPPSRSLRGELEGAQTALAHNNRPAFDAHLENTKELLRDYPAGNERKAAEDVVRVLDDAANVWDAQFESPFFAEGSDAYARASRYPGYADAVRRAMLMDDADHRYYPAAESREFLARVSADRLSRLGIRAPTPRTRVARAEAPRHTTTATVKPATRSTPHRTKTRRHETTKVATKSTKPAASPAPAPRSPDRPAPAKAATAPAPATPPRTTPQASAVPAAPPVADVAPKAAPVTTTTATPTTTTVATATTTSATDTTPTATVDTAAVSTDTAATATTETTDTNTTTAPAPEHRSVVVPALLILIGLGVLIVLFRASK